MIYFLAKTDAAGVNEHLVGTDFTSSQGLLGMACAAVLGAIVGVLLAFWFIGKRGLPYRYLDDYRVGGAVFACIIAFLVLIRIIDATAFHQSTYRWGDGWALGWAAVFSASVAQVYGVLIRKRGQVPDE